MEKVVNDIVDQYEAGRINRRQLIKHLAAFSTAMAASTGAALGAETSSPFTAVEINHVALSVTDVAKSRDFYTKLLGLNVSRESLPGNCFLNVGDNFVALFQADTPSMNHYCYSVEDYDVNTAAEKLKAEGLEPDVHGNRIYFPDPDGLRVQLASKTHRP